MDKASVSEAEDCGFESRRGYSQVAAMHKQAESFFVSSFFRALHCMHPMRGPTSIINVYGVMHVHMPELALVL